jgi:AraC-like DNA-binding protein
MEIINIAFHLVSFLLALLAAYLLLWVNNERKHSNRLLAFVLFLFAVQNLMFILLFSRLMLEIPWLLRIFGPSTFLIGPLTFLYIRSVLNDELKFKKYDWLLIIPAFLALINFIPYYLLPTHEKINYLNDNFYNKAQSQDSGKGMLPSIIYYVIRICWSGVFLFLGFQLISSFRKRNTTALLAQNKILLKWLFTFNCLLAAVLIVTVFKIFIPTIKNTRLTVADLLLGATILFICLQLFMRPQILYGIFQPLPKLTTINITPSVPDVLLYQAHPPLVLIDDTAAKPDEITAVICIDQAEQFRYKNLVETYFREKEPFLQLDYSLEQLVTDTHIPRYILSAFINREYGMGFREFLNRYRVEYLIAHLNKPEWQQFTLEAIATECGFSSRITFFKNFKQITGQTPSKYIKEKHKNGSPN